MAFRVIVCSWILLHSSEAFRVSAKRLSTDAIIERGMLERSSFDHEIEYVEQVLRGEWDTDYHTMLDEWSKVGMSEKRNTNFTHGSDRNLLHMTAASHVFKGSNGSAGTRIVTVTQVLPLRQGEPCAKLEQRFDMMSDVRHTGELVFARSKNDGKMYWTITWDHGRQWWRAPLSPDANVAESCVCDGFARAEGLGGPDCKTTHDSVRWCYVKPGSCPDGKRPSNPDIAKNHDWSNLACEKRSDSGGQAPEAPPDRQGQAKLAQASATEMLKQWDDECRHQEGVREALELDAQVGLSLGAGVGGADVQVDVVFNIGPRGMRSRADRLDCVIERINSYSQSKAKSQSDGSLMQKSIQKVADMLGVYTRIGTTSCWPSLAFQLSFTIVSFPPFLWPIPSVSIGFNWPLHFNEIRLCHDGVSSDMLESIDQAYNARSEDDTHEFGNTCSEAKERLESSRGVPSARQSALGFTAQMDQGPVFTVFPLPSLGWSWSVDVKVSMSMRRVVKGLRNAFDGFVHGSKSKCSRDREEYFGQVAAWAEESHDIASSDSSACAGVRQRFGVIQSEHPDVDYERDPFSLVRHVEQLGGNNFKRDDVETFKLGGGYVYIGLRGFSAGIYANVMDGDAKTDYYHKCKPFKNFVNTYQRRVATSFCEVHDNDVCTLGDFQPLDYHSCRAIDQDKRSGFNNKTMPKFPRVIINKRGRVLEATDSQCTRCLSTTSYGMPCNYCSGETLLYYTSCRSHFGSSIRPPCLSTKVKLPLNSFDTLGRRRSNRALESDIRLRCALASGESNVKVRHSKGRMSSDLPSWVRKLAK